MNAVPDKVLEHSQLEELLLLTPGDLVEVPPVMLGLSPECGLMQVVQVDDKGVKFRVTYYGVHIRSVTLNMNAKGEFQWT